MILEATVAVHVVGYVGIYDSRKKTFIPGTTAILLGSQPRIILLVSGMKTELHRTAGTEIEIHPMRQVETSITMAKVTTRQTKVATTKEAIVSHVLSQQKAPLNSS